jgi:hypothetical protein
MVRLRDDINGCGCTRCQDVKPDILKHSLGEALLWSGRLPFVRPSVLIVFCIIGIIQLGATAGPQGWVLISAIVGTVGVFAGRGYIGIVGRIALGSEQIVDSPLAAVQTVLRRLPIFLGSALIVVGSLLAIVVLFIAVQDPIREALGTAGLPQVVAEGLPLVGLASVFVYILVKLCFLPEACFVGGYGPLNSIRVSWTIATVHRAKAAGLVGGFLVLLSLGVVFDTQFADPGRPVVLSFRYRDTTVVLRSFGFSVTSGVRFTFDLLVTTVYSGVFVHQYVHGIFNQ